MKICIAHPDGSDRAICQVGEDTPQAAMAATLVQLDRATCPECIRRAANNYACWVGQNAVVTACGKDLNKVWTSQPDKVGCPDCIASVETAAMRFHCPVIKCSAPVGQGCRGVVVHGMRARAVFREAVAVGRERKRLTGGRTKLITVDELFGENARREDRIPGVAADALRLLLGKG